MEAFVFKGNREHVVATESTLQRPNQYSLRGKSNIQHVNKHIHVIREHL